MGRKPELAGALALGALCAALLGGVTAWAAAETKPASFTKAQAEHGAQVYLAACQGCHGADLGGGPGGPPLAAAAFRARWRQQDAGALYAFIREKMPPNAGHSLPDTDYADVTAHVLEANGIKPGGAPLPADPAALAGMSLAAAFPAESADAAPTAPAAIPPDATALAAAKRRAERLKAIRPVTDEMLRRPDDGEWVNWRRTYDEQGFSRLAQVNRETVAGLQLAWSWELAPGHNEITPLVHDGILFAASAGRLEALDAASGDLLWRYDHPGAGAVLRNLSIYGDLVYMAVNTDVVALDVHDGHQVWSTRVADPATGVFFTSGGVAAKGKIFQGMSTCSAPYPGGCFIVALDARTGKEAWRFNTLAQPGQPGGDSWNGAPLDRRLGGSVWITGAYDPDLDLLFFGVAQTYRTATLLQNLTGKPGSTDGLYTNSTLAIRPDTGELAWHYQHFARDVWDLDWAFERTLATLTIDGKKRRTVTTGGKLTIFDTLDAKTGRYLFSYDAGLQDLVARIDPKTGAKTVAAKFKPEANVSKQICPSALGGRNWQASAYNPDSGVLFVPMNETCMDFRWIPGGAFDIDAAMHARPGSDGLIGRVQAIDLATHKTLWVRRERAVHASAILATAGGLIFEGDRDRWFRASDDRTGKVLWRTRLNGSVSSFPITFAVDGVQYVAVTAGGGGPLDAWLAGLTPELRTPPSGTTLWVFRLPAPGLETAR